ncbi:type VI secretion system-associated protein TagF [Rhizobium tumorigenes]|uniref:type VI secretion system-associated protein TagF n=1 Tax=Rhizobium tumorigenes TaxID=2041385 RepID=UPI00241D20B4|nr:type VI secretion system-associated protein TagF [Rhizobium tumorigenes]WFS04173.1 type VI secretion system-associated protein TagF [Rhizobium tumorigenes]
MNDRALRQTSTEADKVGFFGKVRSHGDFVSTWLARGLQDALQVWLQSGVQRLQQVFPDDWEARFRTMPTWRFVVERGPWGAATLAGVIVPSLDRVGRRFPLVVVAPVPGFSGDPRRICLDDSWFTAAEGIAESTGRRDFDINEFTAGLKRLRSPHPGDLEPEAGPRASGTLWWRRGDDRRLVGFRTAGSPQPGDLLRLLVDEQPASPPPVAPAQPAVASVQPANTRRPTAPPPAPKQQPVLSLSLRHSEVSHPGTRLSVNADAILTASERGLFALADGIGDGNTAAEAAKIAIAALDEFVPQETMDETVRAIKGKLGRAHGLIQAVKMSFERDPPGSGIAALVIHEQSIALIWAGDVRCYLIRDGMMRCLTRDHLEVGLKRGLSRYLGRPGQFSPEVVSDIVHPGDRLLLCSNPLCRALPERSIAEILISTELAAAADVLGHEALIADCRDNFSAIVIDVGPSNG